MIDAGFGGAFGQSVYVHAGATDGTGTIGSPWNYQHLINAASGGGLASVSSVQFLTGTYEGTLDVRGVQNVAFIAATGATPTLTGSVAVADNLWNGPVTWSATGATNVYWVLLTDIAASASDVFNVYDDNALQQVAREPNTGWFRTVTYAPSTSFTSTDIASTGVSWQGGAVVLRYANWGYAVRTITAHSAGSTAVTYASTGGSNLPPGNYDWGYYIQNHARAFDAPGEWYVDLLAAGGPRLYYIAPNGMAPEQVRVAIHERGIVLQQRVVGTTTFNCSNITVSGLTFEHFCDPLYNGGGDPATMGAGIKVKKGSSNVIIQGCTFLDSRFGIDDVDNAPYPTHLNYTGNSFQRIYRNAIRSGAIDVTIQDNTLLDIGVVIGQAGTDFGGNSAMNINANDMKVSYNTISHVGGAGITANGLEQTTGQHYIRNNVIMDASAALNDHGAISIDLCVGLMIDGNIINGMVPAVESSSQGQFKENKTVGIYFGDKYIRNTTVRGNVVTRCGTGIRVDHSRCSENAQIVNNTLFDNGTQLSLSDYSNWQSAPNISSALGLTVTCGGGGSDANQGQGGANFQTAYGDTYRGNIMYSLNSQQYCMIQESVWAPVTLPLVRFGTFEGNFYFNPFSGVAILQSYKYTRPGIENYLPNKEIAWSLSGWREKFQEETSGSRSPLQILDYSFSPVGQPHVVLSENLNTIAAQTQWSFSNATPDPVFTTFADGAKGLRLVNGNWMENWTSGHVLQVGNGITSGPWRIRCRMRSPDIDMIGVSPVFSFATNAVHSLRYADLGADWKTYELVLDVPNVSALRMINILSNAQFGSDPAFIHTSTIDLDWTEFQAGTLDANYYANEVVTNHVLFYNCPNVAASMQNVGASGIVPGITGQCWSDVHGNFYAAGDEISLAEWASIILFRFDPPPNLAMTNNEYTVTGNEVWSENRNVTGSIIVPNGTSLTIDGAHIGFAASAQNPVTNLIVQPGGILILRNGATLRNWMGCGDPATMWDGVKVLGTGTTTGAGLVVMESGAKITDALTAVRCASGTPGTIFGGDNDAGGIVQATNAVFENNLYDVVTRPHTVVDPATWGPSSFANCTFRRTRALHNAQLPPGARVSLMQSASAPFYSCTFANTTGDYKGIGIQAIGTRVLVEGAEEPGTRARFQGLDFAMLHSAYSIEHQADVDRCDFVDNKRGILIAGADNCRVTRSTFTVADQPVTDLSVEGAYGVYLYGCTAFELEENTFAGTGTEHPKVGLVLRNTGMADIHYSNNTFNGFADASERSCGTVIMGFNASSDGTTGLRIKCNDYSATGTNDYDVAFTGENVLIAGMQGSIGDDTEDPAGNTFANVDPSTCDGNDARHLYEDELGALNGFSYWHHQPQPAVELVPHCNNAPVSLQNTNWPFSKPQSCPVDLSGLVPIGDDEVVAGTAHDEYAVIKEVYSDWKDGGDTEGLIDFIKDPANSSYDVRNQLMLVAPKVSYDAWKECFIRTTPMNPWHLAQALLANSPLEPAVLDLLKESDVDPFYRELVEDGQNGGTSMHSIYKSEIAHFNGVKSGALQAMVRKALRSGEGTDLALATQALGDYPTAGLESEIFALHMATGDLQSARDLVDDQVQVAELDKDLWQVYDLWLALLEDNKKPTDLDGSGIAILENIAGNEGVGAAQAGAWLALLGTSVPEVVLLPNSNKRLKPEQQRRIASTQPLLAAYPNPSNGPVYLTYTVLEGVEQVEVWVHDAQGRVVRQQRVSNSNGIVELSPKQYATGLHVASLYYDGIQVGTAKLNLMR